MRSLLWLALAALLAALLVLVLLSSGDGPREAAGAAIAEPAPTRPAGADPIEPGVEPARDRATAPAAPRSAEALLDVPREVRLAGEGLLGGRVVDAGGTGIPDARVDLLTVPPATTHWIERVLRLTRRDEWVPNTRPVASTLSGEDGAFRFAGLRPGTYFADARAEWWAAAAPEQVRVNRAGSGGPVEILVEPAGAIAGRVVDAAGEGVGGATVAAFHGIGVLLTALRDGDARYVETRADGEGRFTLPGLPPGEGYDVAATGSGLAVSHATDLTVRAGETTEIVVLAREGATLAGTVRSAASPAEAAGAPGELAPVPGAHVGALPLGLRDLHFAPEILAATHAETDGEGRFVLRSVPPGEVDVVAWAPGHLPAVGEPVSVADGGRADGIEVVLTGGALATGRVVDGAGEPLDGVRVRWELGDELVDDSLVRLTPFLTQALDGFAFPVTGVDGTFAAGPFADDPPHRLEFEKAGHESASETWSPGDPPLEVALRRGGAIAGIVIDEALAEPVREFSVLAPKLPSPGQPLAFNPFAGAELFEDPEGRFLVEGLEPGTRSITVTAPGYRSSTVDSIEVVRGEVTRGIIVSLAPGGVVSGVVVDSDGRRVGGARVVAVEGEGGQVQGAPPSGGGMSTSIGLQLGSGTGGDLGLAAGLGLLPPNAARSDASGRFELQGVEPGSVRVAAVHPDYAGGSSELLTLEEGGRLEDVEVVLSAGGGVYGRVTDLVGAPVPRSIVVAVSPSNAGRGGGFAYQDLSDEEGHYAIDAMSPGSYFVVVTQGDEALNLLSFMGRFNFDLVHVPEGRHVRHDVVDASASSCKVYGRVLQDGVPVSGGVLIALSREADNMLGIDFKVARVGADGTYAFAGLRPGDYEFQYQSDSEFQVDVVVPELPELALDVHLPGGRVEGVVVDAVSGRPVEALVTLRAAAGGGGGSGPLGTFFASESRVKRTTAAGDGSFAFTGLSAGEYELSVSGPRWGDDRGTWAPAEPRALELGEGERIAGIEVRLDPALRLRGMAVDADGAPVAGAWVHAVAASGPDSTSQTARTREDGRFELGGLATGSHRLYARHDDYAPSRSIEVELPSADSEDLVLRLTPGATVEVRIHDAAGQPVPGAFATLVGEDGAAAADRVRRSLGGVFDGSAVTGGDGRLDLGRHAPGRYSLEVRRAGSQRTLEGIELEEGDHEVLAVTLP